MKKLIPLGLLFLSSVLFAQEEKKDQKIFDIKTEKVQTSFAMGFDKDIAFTLRIENLNGKELISQNHELGGHKYVKVNVRELPSGHYYVVLSDKEGVELQKEKFEKL